MSYYTSGTDEHVAQRKYLIIILVPVKSKNTTRKQLNLIENVAVFDVCFSSIF